MFLIFTPEQVSQSPLMAVVWDEVDVVLLFEPETMRRARVVEVG
jgi:hypothetical protein